MKRKWNYLLRLFRNMKFRNKLMLTYFIIGIGPVALLGTFCFFQTKNILVEREQKNLQTSLIQSVTNMDNKIKIYNNLSDYISYNQTISEVIGYDTQDEYQKYEQYTKILDPMLTSLKYFHNDLGKITLYTSSSMVQHDTTLDSIQKIREEFWYRKVMSEDFKESYWFVRGDKAISVCSMHSLETMGMRGVLYLDLNVSKLFHNLKKLSQSGYGVIVEDENGNSIFHYEGGGVKKLSLKECQKQRKDYTIAQENSITNWKVWLYKPYRSIINSIWSIVFALFLMVITCVILSVVASTAVSKIMVSRIVHLKQNMTAVELGKMEIMVTSDSQDEVGELIRGFGKMISQINILIEKVYKGELKQKEYEMKALQAQINPHFLYNSLSLINWKAIAANQTDISRLTLLLSTFYRTALNKGNSILSIGDELNNMQSYLSIQLMMHDDSFDTCIEVPEEMKQYASLNLLLQPLVENAIDHGIDLKENGRGEIAITGKMEDNDIYLYVTDNGIGMDDKKAERILTQQSKGYGVRNVHERIQLFFGKEYGLTVKSVPNEGTCITIHMPKRTM